MATLAFCGLGQMGEPMARRLLDAGHDLAVWNRTPERAATLVERGARRAASPAETAEGADGAVTMLATPAAVEQVVFGERGLAAGLRAGAALVEMSTIGPHLARAIGQRLPAGVEMLDAPVLGSVRQATEGVLQVFVGGPEPLFARWRPVLEHLGRPVHFGALGDGAAMKLVANATLGVLMAGLGEALALADALGLDEGLVLDALSASPIGATTTSKRDKIETGEYPPNFKLSLAAKDLRLVTEAATEAGLDLGLNSAARSWLEAADEGGLGELDYSAVIAHVRGRGAGKGAEG